MVRIVFVSMLLALPACFSTHAEPAEPETNHSVDNIALSTTRGEVGKPFESQLTWQDNYITEPEIQISGLPPGLHFDAAKRTVVGTPTQDGFFTVDIAVRKKVDKSDFHRPKIDERWWPAEIEISIYKPMKD